MRDGWHSIASIDAPAMVAASGCAPPMPPRPAVRIHLPRELAAVVPAAELSEGLVRALHDALRADVDPRARGHLAVHHEALAIELVEVLQVAHCGTRLEFAISTRGASAWVRNTPTGLPDCTNSVSSCSRLRSAATIAVEALPVARRPPDAAVNHQLVRLLGDLGVEVVHQHAQRRFGEPALGGKLRAARRPNDAGVVETSGHRFLFKMAGTAPCPSLRVAHRPGGRSTWMKVLSAVQRRPFFLARSIATKQSSCGSAVLDCLCARKAGAVLPVQVRPR